MKYVNCKHRNARFWAISIFALAILLKDSPQSYWKVHQHFSSESELSNHCDAVSNICHY